MNRTFDCVHEYSTVLIFHSGDRFLHLSRFTCTGINACSGIYEYEVVSPADLAALTTAPGDFKVNDRGAHTVLRRTTNRSTKIMHHTKHVLPPPAFSVTLSRMPVLPARCMWRLQRGQCDGLAAWVQHGLCRSDQDRHGLVCQQNKLVSGY